MSGVELMSSGILALTSATFAFVSCFYHAYVLLISCTASKGYVMS